MLSLTMLRALHKCLTHLGTAWDTAEGGMQASQGLGQPLSGKLWQSFAADLQSSLLAAAFQY